MTRFFAFAALLLIAAAPIATWPFPGLGVAADPSPAAAADVVRLPGSPMVFHQSDLQSMARAIDWFPGAHPPAPDVVMRAGRDGAYPCGYCHLADGRGRPENASLRGLPAGYIVEQVEAFASLARRAASPGYAPTRYMAGVAHAIRPADLQAAAAYFSAFEPQSHTRIVEAATIPAAAAWHFVYRFDASRQEALGARIVEGPVDRTRFALRDPETAYIAYVPEGAIGRGQAIAERGASGGPACAGCHGKALAGIAGASPTYVARQLMGFRSRTRNDPGAAPMQAVAAHLTDAQIIDVAAFVGSKRPWRHADVP
jgi:cytochrome c553